MLSYLLGVEEARPRDLDPEQLKRQIVLAARLLVERRLAQGPLLVIVDDFHWADAASADLLRDLADPSGRPAPDDAAGASARRPRAVIAGAEQIGDPPRARFADADQAVRRPPVRRAAAACLRARCATSSLTRAGGNPLFVEEIVRSLVGSGVLVREGRALGVERERRDGEPAAHAARPAAVARRQAAGRHPARAAGGRRAGRELRRGAAAGASPATCGRALERLVEADLVRRRGAGPRRAGAIASPTRCCTRWSTRTCCCRGAASCTNAPAARSRQAVGPVAGADSSDLEALGHHWSFTSDKARGARYLTAAGDRARAVYANDDAIRHYERALATLASCLACDDQVRIGARAAGRPAGAHRAARRCAGALRGGARRSSTAAGRRRRRGAPPPQDRRAALGERATASAPGPASPPASTGWAKTGDPIERAQLYQEIGRLAFRAGDNAGAIAWAERALAEAAQGGRAAVRRRARARDRGDAGAGLQHAGRGAGAHGPASRRRWSRIEQSIALAEAPRSAAGDLPRLHEPRRALELARPAAQHRDLPARARGRAEGRRSRLPVAAVRQPRGGLLRADRSLRGGGHRGGGNRHRPRPPARPDRPSGRAADRARPDPPMPRRPGARVRLLPGGAGAGRAGRRATASIPLLRWTCYALSRCRGRSEGRALPGEGPGGLRAGRRRARRAAGPAVSLLEDRGRGNGGFT